MTAVGCPVMSSTFFRHMRSGLCLQMRSRSPSQGFLNSKDSCCTASSSATLVRSIVNVFPESACGVGITGGVDSAPISSSQLVARRNSLQALGRKRFRMWMGSMPYHSRGGVNNETPESRESDSRFSFTVSPTLIASCNPSLHLGNRIRRKKR